MTRLQNHFLQHQTTDDTTNNDYDYSLEEDDTNEPTQFTLPLIPILSHQDSQLIASDKPQPSSQEYKIELNKFSFSQPSSSEDQTVTPDTTVDDGNDGFVSSTAPDLTKYEKNATQGEVQESSSIQPLTLDQSTTDKAEYETLPDYSDATETTDSRDITNEDDNYPQTTLSELSTFESESSEKKHEAGKTSNETENDYFENLFTNESLLIDNTSSYENLTEFDYDSATTQPSIDALSEESSGDGRGDKLETTAFKEIIKAESTTVREFIRTDGDAAATFVASDKIKFEDDQIDDGSEKFVYRTLDVVLPTPPTTVRFPQSQASERSQRVRFPDDSIRVTWPRETGYHLMRFWQEQPLINDDKSGHYEVLHRRHY